MNFLVWIVIGGIIGWLASVIMATEPRQGVWLNTALGTAGALLGGWLLAPLFGTATIGENDFSIVSLFVSFLGALLLLAAVNFFRRRRAP